MSEEVKNEQPASITESLFEAPPMAEQERKLSRAAIETLAIIAYHQPVTRAEIEEIRGVSVSSGTIDMLLELDWIKLGRRRMTPGRPVTFIVTQTFLWQLLTL